MDLKKWSMLDEALYVCESDERYKQYAGQPYSEHTINRLANLKAESARLFLDSFSEPRALYLSCLESLADSSAKKQELRLYNLRNEKIVSSKYRWLRHSVNWSNWRQFNSSEPATLIRKQVFDEFISKTRYIAPLISKRFQIIADSYRENSKGKVTPLDGYLENEQMSLAEMTDFVKKMGASAKKPLQESLQSISQKVLSREPAYYDDFYFFRNVVYSQFERHFASISPVAQAQKTLESLGFDMSNISIDTEDRKNKYPSPICFFVKIPTDVRVLYKGEGAYFDTQGCYHEMGHAMHAISIDAELDYWWKYSIPMGIAEIFSIFLERLTKDKKYLKYLGIKDVKVLDELEERNRFMELYFIAFYTANSLMKTEFWRRSLTIDQASELYARLIREYLGFEMPGEYWMLHHILPEATMYVPSYLVAAVRAAELEKTVKDRYGDSWWLAKESGNFLREIMEQGAKIGLTQFSKMNAEVYLAQIRAS